jgi:AcrR family transcriptional regulator
MTRVDGRTLRAQRTRQAIVDALLDLIESGVLLPTGEQIAARANVALRSIRQHFESRESLMLAAAERHAERAPSPGELTVEGSLRLDMGRSRAEAERVPVASRPAHTPTRRIWRRFAGVNGMAYCPEKQAWQKLDLPLPTAASIPSSER